MATRLRAFRAASTFDRVAALYQSLTPWRDGNHYGCQIGENKHIENASQARSLSPHMKRYVTLRPVEYGYAARYHDTDVVTWTRRRTEAGPACDYVEVQGYTSISTESIVDDFTPSNLRFKLTLDDGFYVRVAMHPRVESAWYYSDNDTARCYEFDDTIKFEIMGGSAMPVEGATKTTIIDPLSPKMRLALKQTRYHDFLNYARARVSINTPMLTRNDMRQSINYDNDIVGLLADPNKWDDILFSATFYGQTFTGWVALVENISMFLRDRIYRHAKAIDVREVEWYPWSQFEAQRKLRARYPWAIY